MMPSQKKQVSKKTTLTLGKVCVDFLLHCESAMNLSIHTLMAYRSDLEDAQVFFGNRKKFRLIDKDILRRYIKELRETRCLKESTIKRRLATLKVLFRWSIRELILEINPFETLNERIRIPQLLPRALDRGDQASLTKVLVKPVNCEDFETLRDRAAVQILLGTGIRVGELVAIKRNDVSLSNKCVVIHGKGNRQRLVYLLQKPVFRHLEKYLEYCKINFPSAEKLLISIDGNALSTANIRTALRKICSGAGLLKHVTPHMLRHTCATHWLELGLDIRHVQKLLGHQSISTTEIYTHVSDRGLRDALERAYSGEKR
jgi:site-specific recombinase XerD